MLASSRGNAAVAYEAGTDRLSDPIPILPTPPPPARNCTARSTINRTDAGTLFSVSVTVHPAV